MKLKLILLTAVAVCASVLAKANTTPPETSAASATTEDMAGAVFHADTKKPLGSVTITATHLGTKKEKVVVTNDDGDYSFSDLEAGIYKFVFAKSGYKKVVKDKIYIRQNEAVQIDVALTPHNTYDFLPGLFSFSEDLE